MDQEASWQRTGERRLEAALGTSPEESAAAIKSYQRLASLSDGIMRDKVLAYSLASSSDPKEVKKGLMHRPRLLLVGREALLLKQRLADDLMARHPPWREELCSLSVSQRLTLIALPASRLARLHFIECQGWADVNSMPLSVILGQRMADFRNRYHPFHSYRKGKDGANARGLNKYLTTRERDVLLQRAMDIEAGGALGGGLGEHWDIEELNLRKVSRGNESLSTWLTKYRRAYNLLQNFNEREEFQRWQGVKVETEAEAEAEAGIPAGITPKNEIGIRVTRRGRWRVQISKNKNRNVYLGTYDTEDEAARVFDMAAYYLRGEKAILNFPGVIPSDLSADLKKKLKKM